MQICFAYVKVKAYEFYSQEMDIKKYIVQMVTQETTNCHAYKVLDRTLKQKNREADY